MSLASESSTTPEIAEKSAKGEDEENHLHDLIANPEDEAVKNLKPEALEVAKALTEMLLENLGPCCTGKAT